MYQKWFKRVDGAWLTLLSEFDEQGKWVLLVGGGRGGKLYSLTAPEQCILPGWATDASEGGLGASFLNI